MHETALLIGFLGAPLWLLAVGHRLRYRTSRVKRLFWGALTGHTSGLVIALAAMVFPSISWESGGQMRVLLVHWSMLAGVLLGLSVAVAVRRFGIAGSS